MIDIIVPVLDRPKNVATLMDSLEKTEGFTQVQAWFVCEFEYLDEQQAVTDAGAQLIITDKHTFAEKVNLAYTVTGAPWLLLAGDDVRFHPGWFNEVLRVAAATGAKVVSTNDLSNPFVMAGHDAIHPVINREYVDDLGSSWDGPGVVCHEGYQHHGPDTEIVDVAISRGVFAPAVNAVIEHYHPDADKADWDVGYTLAEENHTQDTELFFARRSHFLPGGRDLSKILREN